MHIFFQGMYIIIDQSPLRNVSVNAAVVTGALLLELVADIFLPTEAVVISIGE